MFKKALIATAVLAATSGLAFANGGTVAMPVEATHVGNCYVAAGISGDFAQFSSDFSTDDFFGTGRSFSRNSNLGAQGVDGELLIGYGWLMNDHYWFGAEVFGTISSASANNDISFTDFAGNDFSLNSTTKLRGKWGIRALLGTKISDSTLLYGLVGWVDGRFKEEGNFTFNAATGSGLDSDSGSFDGSTTKSGIQVGGGLRTQVTNTTFVGLQYDWNRFSSIGNGRFSTRPTVQEVTFLVGWNFYS